ESIARTAIQPHSPSSEKSHSLYTHLLSNGVIVQRVDRYWEEDSPVSVRFAFERFSDYFIARALLSDIGNAAGLRGAVADGGRLAWIQSWDTYLDNRGLARALAILVPEQFGVELIDVLPELEHRG